MTGLSRFVVFVQRYKRCETEQVANARVSITGPAARGGGASHVGQARI